MDLLRMAMENEDDDLVYLLLQERRPQRTINYNPEWAAFDLNEYSDDQCWNDFR